VSNTPVTGVDFVTVPTQDITAAIEFYGSKLGLECSVIYDKVPGAEFETGSLTLQLIDSKAIGNEFHANSMPIGLHVEDIKAAREELESRGISFGAETMDTGVCHMAFFKDADGNPLMLHNRYIPRS
jgi:predicted enzyme related to lactoylglutathione lyase